MSSKCVLRYVKLTTNAYAPTKGSAKSAGFDLKSAYDCVIPARGRFVVKTDLQIEIPEGSYGRVAPRSGLAVKNFIDVGAGVIDEDYRGNIGVVLINHAEADFEVKRGDRIAQLICEQIFYPELKEEKSLSKTDRGEGGFGSTGVNDNNSDNKIDCSSSQNDSKTEEKSTKIVNVEGVVGSTNDEKNYSDAPKEKKPKIEE